MLKIRNLKHLARQTKFTTTDLERLCDSIHDYCDEWTLHDPRRPERQRKVLCVSGKLRRFQDCFLRQVLMKKLNPSSYAHGGVVGRNIKTNVLAHRESFFVYSTDIKDFFPSISREAVYKLFLRLDCTPDVARICTRLCTWEHGLALGLVTSPFLAEQIMAPVDIRIASACKGYGDKSRLVYTRFVDDISVSARIDLGKTGIAKTVEAILSEYGFRVNPKKEVIGRIGSSTPITTLVVHRGRLNVHSDYVTSLEGQIEDASRLARGVPIQGQYHSKDAIAGRIHYVAWINPGRSKDLWGKFHQVPWKAVSSAARELGLESSKRCLLVRSKC